MGTYTDALLGVLALFIAFGVTVSGLLEVLNTALHRRGEFMWRGIRGLIGEPPGGTHFTSGLRTHPALLALCEDRDPDKPPSYIPSTVFASALHGLLLGYRPLHGPRIAGTADAIAALPLTYGMRDLLQLLWARAQGSEERFVTELAGYYDLCMDRVSGWYKRDCQRNSVLLGLLLAACLHVDAFEVARYFRLHPAETVQFVERTIADGAPRTDGTAKTATKQVPAALPIGRTTWPTAADLMAGMPGYVVMALSCLVAPSLWYQILTHLLPWRTAGRKPERVEPTLQERTAPDVVPLVPVAAPREKLAPVARDGAMNPLELRLERDGRVVDLQAALGVARTGKLDGPTRVAIRQRQATHAFQPTGELTRHLVDLILANPTTQPVEGGT